MWSFFKLIDYIRQVTKVRRITIICFCFALLLTGCQSVVGNDYDSVEELSTSHYSDITNRHFEEISTGYRAAFFAKDEISTERIMDWLDSRLPGEGFHRFIYSDPASWDMFIYYHPEDGLYAHYSFRFSIMGSTVTIYVVTDDASPAFLSNYLLIRVQAPPRSSPWPSNAVLYIDGVNIEKHVDG